MSEGRQWFKMRPIASMSLGPSSFQTDMMAAERKSG
jgi:hypothetical protein